jgi:threonine/homoserine/homoserine lactone efflux protein
MPLESWLAFSAATIVLLVVPGPTLLIVIGYSIAHGRRVHLPLVAAVALGDSTALVLSLLGLGTVLAASAMAFSVLKWAGGLYLLYLAWRMLRSGISVPPDIPEQATKSAWGIFAHTYAVTALNPKGIVFFVAFMPQFLDGARPAALQLAVMGSTFVLLASCNAALYARFASTAQRAFASPRAQRRFNLAGALLLGSAGVWALIARRTG